MKIQKGIAMSLFMLTVLVLIAGCSRSGRDSGGKASEKVTLTVWGDQPNQAILEDCFNEINAAFTRKYPDIILDYQWSGSIETINVALQSDSLPDLFWVQGNKTSAMAEMARAGFLLPLDQFNPDKSFYPPASVEYAQVDGVTYCTYPAFLDYTLVYYNADIFAAHGLKKPATYDEFVAATETLYAAGITPFSLGGDFEWSRYWPLQTLCSSLANNDLGRIKNGDINSEYPELVYTFDQFREFCNKGYFGENPGAMDESSAQLAFSNGRVAMIFEGGPGTTTCLRVCLLPSAALPCLTIMGYGPVKPVIPTSLLTRFPKNPNIPKRRSDMLNFWEALKRHRSLRII
jgi:raffinose/stachyose/melibiose transport system substrate-binding protein